MTVTLRGWLRAKPARPGKLEEDWFALVDDDGMPFDLSRILHQLNGREVELTFTTMPVAS